MTEQQKAQEQTIGERQALALPLELEEGAPPFLVRRALSTLCGMVICMLIWSNIASVREYSMAIGEVAPLSATRELAHLEGGIVEKVEAKAGDQVSQGDPLVVLRKESADDSFARYNARRADLEIRTERLAALAEGRLADFGSFEEEWPSLVTNHRASFDHEQELHQQSMLTFVERVNSAKAELDGASAARRETKEQLRLAAEQYKIQEQLMKEEFTSRQALLESKSALSFARAAAADAGARYEKAQSTLATAQSEHKSALAEFQKTILEQKTAAVAELLELKQPILNAADRDERRTIRAPISGLVKDLTVDGPGDVIRAGEPLGVIVPADAEMIAEVRLQPKDIGHIAIDQKAEVTLTTFDPKKYGVLRGYVSHISADSFIDERTGEYYFKALITLQATKKKEYALQALLSPGMETQVRIITQSRSLMAYLLKPVARSLDGAFSER